MSKSIIWFYRKSFHSYCIHSVIFWMKMTFSLLSSDLFLLAVRSFVTHCWKASTFLCSSQFGTFLFCHNKSHRSMFIPLIWKPLIRALHRVKLMQRFGYFDYINYLLHHAFIIINLNWPTHLWGIIQQISIINLCKPLLTCSIIFKTRKHMLKMVHIFFQFKSIKRNTNFDNFECTFIWQL